MKSRILECRVNSLLGVMLDDAESFTNAFKCILTNFPEAAPERWNIVEPINKPFDIHEIEKKASSSNFDMLWKRISYPKGWGSIQKITYPKKGAQHARFDFELKIRRDLESKLCCFLKKIASKFSTDYISINFSHPEYCRFQRLSDGEFVPTWVLRKWLPDIFWGQIFGRPYIDLFGMEKLLSCPAYKVEMISDDLVYMQITESIFDAAEDYSYFDAKRNEAKMFLDDNIFFDPEKSVEYVRRLQSQGPEIFEANKIFPEDHIYKTPEFKIDKLSPINWFGGKMSQ
ncbi:hypothetical protein [Oryzomicrobium sp.]|uniref:hypothetical protein n=1 Tax=Oryzomicrobium sp. TaxID=1911578 RepID=UPI0025CBF08E|nr:hypothetical protein [Oryzomicrobium sp.]MCE1244335.1 hypothetical protein [Oryzomicrobium sp.]